jgi:excisionase family DNA binding protein
MTDDFTGDLPIPDNLEESYRHAAAALLQNRPLRAWSPAGRTSGSLSSSERDTLSKAGLALEPWKSEIAQDPLTRTVVDYAALLDSSFTTTAVAKLLGVNSSRIRQRADEGSLFAIRDGAQWRFPRFQFERKRVLPGLALVLKAKPPEINPLDVAEWFLSPNPDLEAEDPSNKKDSRTLSPREWLLSGRAAHEVATLFRHL